MLKRMHSPAAFVSHKHRASEPFARDPCDSPSSNHSDESDANARPNVPSSVTSAAASEIGSWSASSTTSSDTSDHILEASPRLKMRGNLAESEAKEGSSRSNAVRPPQSTPEGHEMEITGVLTRFNREASYDGTIIMTNVVSRHGSPQQSLSAPPVPKNTPDNFPIFTDGDVYITLDNTGGTVQLLLHSAVLARNSPWFAQSLQELDSSNCYPSWYSYNLDFGIIGSTTPQLVRQPTKSERPVLEHSNILIKTETVGDRIQHVYSGESSSAAVARPYYDMLAHFYGAPLPITTTNIRTALAQSQSIVTVARQLDCLPLVSAQISNILSDYRQALFIAIKDDPANWIQLAIALQSRSIFTECFVHLVGAHPFWPSTWRTKRTVLSPQLRHLIASKSKALDELCVDTDRDLLMNTIEHAKHKRPIGPEDRPNLQTWLAISVFRDAVARRLHAIERHKSRSRGDFYRRIAKGGSAYMDYEEVRSLCEGLHAGDWPDLGDDLKALKQRAGVIVQGLAANELMISPDEHGIGYLTCVEVETADLPWLWK